MLGIGFENPKSCYYFPAGIEGSAVTCLKVPALSSDILTKVRELSQLQFHYKLHENTKMLHLIQQTCKTAVCAQAEQPCRL